MDGESEPMTDVKESISNGEEPMETTPTTELCSAEPRQETDAMTTEQPKAPEDNDDDVVLLEEPRLQEENVAASPSSNPAPAEVLTDAKTTDHEESAATASSNTPPPSSIAEAVATPQTHTEPIVIDDEEDTEQRGPSSLTAGQSGEVLSSTEPDSEIKIASVTTLGTSEVAMATSAETSVSTSAEEGINLMITSVTSLKGDSGTEVAGEEGVAENGLQISSTFSLNPDAQQSQESASRPSSTFNPGRVNSSTQPVQNGETGTHQRSGNAYIQFMVF